MFSPAIIQKVMGLVSRVGDVQATAADSAHDRATLARELAPALKDAGEVSRVGFNLDGKPVLVVVCGPVGSRQSLPF